ncbi:hypothetical protein HZF05_15300 [Sphingomonas sp. CGMCC 1.13654]|uniref:Uncharacterized protein n=1 Tax=Sphingomonas chungangi TaxID=2683589 RepID=A0A838L9H8_9SPHN|nr:hypothetical protein [Sphingomonas chungangi]MBA2935452.1 hypothetical protein [Sphingomonas chungangi]MVW56959.1 hypothetical protein [Sphingomonas chungangi]
MRILMLSALLLAAMTAQARQPSLDKELAGRTAARPTNCIQQNFIDSSDTFDGAILYRMKSGPDYLNRPEQCPLLRPGRGLATSTPGTSLCRGDIVQIIDFTSHFNYGSCGLGDFVPYAKAKKPQ